jgi:hypothetical protein
LTWEDILDSQIMATAAIASTAAPANELAWVAAAPVNWLTAAVLLEVPGAPTGAAEVPGGGVGATTTTEVMVVGRTGGAGSAELTTGT